jgi:precorrin-6B methylase 2
MGTALLGILLAGGLIAVVLVFFYTLRTGVPVVSSSAGARELMLDLVPVNFRGTLVELGSGWGALTVPLATQNPDCPVIAVELSPVPWLVLHVLRRVFRLHNLQILRGDFFKMSLVPADMVFCYLLPRTMERLAVKLHEELRPGSLVVSNSFPLPGWQRVSAYPIPDDADGNFVVVYEA